MSENESRLAGGPGFIKRSLLLLAAVAGLWLLSVWPANRIAGRDGLVGLSVAAVLCFVPGLVVFGLAGNVAPGSPKAATMVLVGSGLRMAAVLAGVLVIREYWPRFGFREFLVWVLIFYLGTLALETLLLLKRPAVSG